MVVCGAASGLVTESDITGLETILSDVASILLSLQRTTWKPLKAILFVRSLNAKFRIKEPLHSHNHPWFQLRILPQHDNYSQVRQQNTASQRQRIRMNSWLRVRGKHTNCLHLYWNLLTLTVIHFVKHVLIHCLELMWRQSKSSSGYYYGNHHEELNVRITVSQLAGDTRISLKISWRISVRYNQLSVIV